MNMLVVRPARVPTPFSARRTEFGSLPVRVVGVNDQFLLSRLVSRLRQQYVLG
jgi:hypothetical protein